MAKKRCTECGINPVIGGPAGDIQADLCEDCYDVAGWENTHSDNSHESLPPDHPERQGCPVCKDGEPEADRDWPEDEPEIRAPQVSHRSCDHPRTKNARAACRRKRNRDI